MQNVENEGESKEVGRAGHVKLLAQPALPSPRSSSSPVNPTTQRQRCLVINGKGERKRAKSITGTSHSQAPVLTYVEYVTASCSRAQRTARIVHIAEDEHETSKERKSISRRLSPSMNQQSILPQTAASPLAPTSLHSCFGASTTTPGPAFAVTFSCFDGSSKSPINSGTSSSSSSGTVACDGLNAKPLPGGTIPNGCAARRRKCVRLSAPSWFKIPGNMSVICLFSACPTTVNVFDGIDAWTFGLLK